MCARARVHVSDNSITLSVLIILPFSTSLFASAVSDSSILHEGGGKKRKWSSFMFLV